MNETAQSSAEYVSLHFVLAAHNSSFTVMVLCSQHQTILISDQQFSVKLQRKALWPGHSQSINPAVVGLDTLKLLPRDRGSTQAMHCTRE